MRGSTQYFDHPRSALTTSTAVSPSKRKLAPLAILLPDVPGTRFEALVVYHQSCGEKLDPEENLSNQYCMVVLAM